MTAAPPDQPAGPADEPGETAEVAETAALDDPTPSAEAAGTEDDQSGDDPTAAAADESDRPTSRPASRGNSRPGRNRRRGVFLRPARQPRSKLRRRIGSTVRMVAALMLVGGLYAGFAPAANAEDTGQLSASAQEGQGLYDQSCISCHGKNAEGVNGKGPSLIGVGSAAVEFQVTTGRMPLAQQQNQADRKKPSFTGDQATDIGAYIEALGGGPQLPDGTDLHSNGDVSRGGEIFRVNCSSCHAFGTGGGALSSGKFAPSLSESTDRQLYAAMLTGPENMPVFGDNQLTPQEKQDIIAYVQNLKQDQDPGGWGIGRLGPVPEALVIFLIGMVFLVVVTLWIAGKS